MFDQWQKEARDGEKLEDDEAKAAKAKADAEWYEGERKAKQPSVPVVEGISCACGKPVEKESPQIDQCLACFNRN